MNGWVTKQTDDANYGFKPIFLDNTGAGANFWGANGPHYTQINDNSYPQFEVGYASLEWSHASEQGMLNANGIAARNWWLQNQIGMVSDKTQTRAEYVVRWQYGHLFDEFHLLVQELMLPRGRERTIHPNTIGTAPLNGASVWPVRQAPH